MTKQDWISHKIQILEHENKGRSHEQNVAIAYSMWEQMQKKQEGGIIDFYKFKEGGIPMFQNAGTKNPAPGSVKFMKPQPITEVETPPVLDLTATNNTTDPTHISLLENATPDAMSNIIGEQAEDLTQTDADKNLVNLANQYETEDKVNGMIKNQQEPYQFFNPYSGVDVPTAAVTLGQSIENKDTLGTVASGLKVATGLARNVLGGLGTARRANYLDKQRKDNLREYVTQENRPTALEMGGYYQDGGSQQEQQLMQMAAMILQQVGDPQAAVQELVNQGVPQEVAAQAVMSIAQQQQNTPQFKKGGNYDSYYQDGGTTPREVWEEKTGLPWSDAKRLGYTSGSAQDNIKLMGELNSGSFKKENLRKNAPQSNVQPSNTFGIYQPTNSFGVPQPNYNLNFGQTPQKPVATKKPTPQLKKQTAEEEKEQPSSSFATKIIQNTVGAFLPEQVSQLVSRTVTGDKGYSLDELPKDVRAAVYKSVMNAKKRTGKASGGTDYVDYGGEATQFRNSDNMTAGKMLSLKPEVQAAGITGRVSYETDPKTGKILIYDTYDFSNKDKEFEGKDLNLYQSIRKNMGHILPEEKGDRRLVGSFDPRNFKEDGGHYYYQDGGQEQLGGQYPNPQETQAPQEGQEQQVMQQVTQLLQSGTPPEEIVQQLTNSGVPPQQAQEMVAMAVQQLQGQTQQMQGTPEMRSGGKYLDIMKGRKIKDYKFNSDTNNYEVEFE